MQTRSAKLMSYLAEDGANLGLLTEAAGAAFDEGAYDLSADMISRYERLAPLPAGLANLKAMIAIQHGLYQDAIALLERVRQNQDSPQMRFNLAWALAMQGAFSRALPLLDDQAIAASPRGAWLKLKSMHHLGLLENALDEGARLLIETPKDTNVAGALAVIALDAERRDLAQTYANMGASTSDGMAVEAMLALEKGAVEQAAPLLDRALRQKPDDPRALIALGLCRLLEGDIKAGAAHLRSGAEIFGVHAGAWTGAGWAFVTDGDVAAAQLCFEKALVLDENFSEPHGALAFLDLEAGDLQSAQRRAEIALRLDPDSYSGNLARMLLLQQASESGKADEARDKLLNAPLGADGASLARIMTKLMARGVKH